MAGVKFVKRKNEVLRVREDAVDSYLKNGYDLLDDTGKKVVKEGTRATYSAAEYNSVVKENTSLREQLSELQRKFDELSAKKGK